MASKIKKVAIYARVSTDKQTTENQLRELREVAARNGWIVSKEYIDHGISGAKGRDKRPAFDALLKDAVRKEFDVIAVWSVDRLSRSLRDLLSFLDEIHAKGIGLYLHQQGVDTTTPGGKALFQMVGVFAEFERAIIQERIKAGLARAREQGTILGRPPVGQKTEAKILALRGTGVGMLKIAKQLGVGTGTVQRVVKQAA